MEQTYFVSPREFAVSAATAAGSAAIAVICIILGRYLSALVFAVITLVFLKMTLDAGARLSVGQTGITRRLFGKITHQISWEELSEVGIAGSKVFNKGNPAKTGTVYIYFSKEPMDDQERFNMMLKWPPKDKLYLSYNRSRLDFVKTVSGKEITGYNIGKLKV